MRYQTILNVFSSITNDRYEEIYVVNSNTVELNGSLIFVGKTVVSLISKIKSGKKISNRKLNLILKNVDQYSFDNFGSGMIYH